MMMPPPIPTRPDKIPVAKPSKSEMKIVTSRPLDQIVELLLLACGIVLADDHADFDRGIWAEIFEREANALVFGISNFASQVAFNAFARIDNAEQHHLSGAIGFGIALAEKPALPDYTKGTQTLSVGVLDVCARFLGQ